MTNKPNTTIHKLIDKTGDLVASGLGKIFGPAAEEIGGTLGDTAGHWRWKNRLRINDKVQKELKRRNVNPQDIHQLPPSIGHRVLDGCALEDDDSIQDMWAKLIANAADPNVKFEVRKIHIDLLRELEPVEANLLQNFKRVSTTVSSMVDRNKLLDLIADAFACPWGVLNESDQEIILRNLLRKELIYKVGMIQGNINLFQQVQLKNEQISLNTINPREMENLLEALGEALNTLGGTGKVPVGLTREYLGFAANQKAIWELYGLSEIGKEIVRACNNSSEPKAFTLDEIPNK